MKSPKSKHKLRTILDLVRHLGINESFLRELVDELTSDETKLYRSWEEPKKLGGTRPIDAPREKLKSVQKLTNERILQPTRIHRSAIGGIPGKRLIDNLKIHIGKPMVANFDLKSFFTNISCRQVFETFRAIGISPKVAEVLTRLTTFKGRIPQGAPTSTMLANIVAGYEKQRCLDRRIEGLCRDHGSQHRRWIDDLAISGPKYLPKLKGTVETIIEQSGFKLNIDKISFASDKEPQVVTGHLVNVKPNIRKDERRRLRAILHKCRTIGPERVAEDSTERLRNRLRGKIAHIRSVNPELGDKFLKDFNSIQWPDK
jgi:retron-type reverse transcriptase